jgi:hypothetical protein
MTMLAIDTSLINYTVFWDDGIVSTTSEIYWPTRPNSEQLHDLLDPILGGPFEHVTVWVQYSHGEFRRADMFVREGGRMLDLPRNEIATALYRTARMSEEPYVDPEALDWVAGTAVLFHDRVWL